MEERKHTSNGVPTFEMIPMLMANLLEDNKILSAKLDAINRKISASVGNSKDDDQRMDVTEAQKNTYLAIQLFRPSMVGPPTT